MLSGTASTRGALHKRLRDLIVQACEADNVDLISQTIGIDSSPDSSDSPEQVIKMKFPRVFSRNAPKVLYYILTHIDVKDLASSYNIAALYIAYASYEREKGGYD